MMRRHILVEIRENSTTNPQNTQKTSRKHRLQAETDAHFSQKPVYLCCCCIWSCCFVWNKWNYHTWVATPWLCLPKDELSCLHTHCSGLFGAPGHSCSCASMHTNKLWLQTNIDYSHFTAGCCNIQDPECKKKERERGTSFPGKCHKSPLSALGSAAFCKTNDTIVLQIYELTTKKGSAAELWRARASKREERKRRGRQIDL